METTSATQQSEVQASKEVATEEIKGGQPSELFGNLESAVKEAMTEIHHCDDQIQLWQDRRQSLQAKVNQMLDGLKRQFNGPVGRPQKKSRAEKGSTVPALIFSYLEGHGPARTRDIRKFLLSKGKKTNPGVALGRMVKSGDLKHAERGTYQLA
jgi:hypothetical protein